MGSVFLIKVLLFTNYLVDFIVMPEAKLIFSKIGLIFLSLKKVIAKCVALQFVGMSFKPKFGS